MASNATQDAGSSGPATEMNPPEQGSLKPPQLAALGKEEEDKLSDYVTTNDSNAPSMQPSRLPSAANSGDELESEPEDDKSDGEEQPDTEMGPEGGDSKTPRQQRAQDKKDAKKAQSSKLERQRAGVGGKKLADSIKRFSYLLGQTDLFSHFCDLKKERDPEFAKLLEEAEAQAAPKRGRKGNTEGSRRRKSEKEEDAELLNDEEHEGDDAADAPFVFTESPIFVEGGQMRDYQVQGLNWMVGLNHNGINGILADEMGLGKTLQTISFLGYLKFIRNIPGPHLIVVPKSTQDNWVREVARWVPGFSTVDLRGNKEERAQIMNSRILAQDFDIVITSYEICQREKNGLKKISWEYIVIDEAHRIKNVDSLLSQIVRLFDSRHRLLITGTPLQNNLQELWALLNFLLPDVFSSSEDFDKWFESRGGEGDDSGDKVVQQLHKVLRPFLLRRVKADVEKSLLPKREINVYVGMTEMQRKWYRSLLEKDIDAVNGIGSKKEGKTRLLNIVMQLRKCCNHPYLFDGAEPGPPFTTDEHLVFNAGKMVVLDKLLKSMKAKGSRVLIFSQMSRMLDILEDYCHFREYKYCRLDGQTSHEDRMAAIDSYNAPDSDKFLFLLTTRAGGLGINLTTADVVVLFDSDWNPQADLQAMDRAHRIGQKKQVFVFRFVTEAAVEEKVLERAAQKLRLDQLVIQQGRQAPSKNQGSSKDDILEMIQHGAERIINSSETMNVEDDIDSIIKKGEERTAALNDKYSSLNIHDLANFTTDAPGTTTWEGEKFGGKKRLGNLWIEPSSRRPGHKEGAMNVNTYYGNTLQTSGRRPGPAKAPRPPGYKYDFMFYPREFYALQERDTAAHQRREGYVVPLGNDKTKSPEQLEAERQAAQDIIDNSVDLTEEEKERKGELEAQDNFSHWGKREFQAFIRGCEMYGRTDYEGIAREIEQKSTEEVAAYGKVFWQRYKELEDWEKQIKKIDDAEDKRKNQNHAGVLLSRKIATASHPLQNLSIPYAAQTKGKTYSEEEDRFMLVRLDHHGYTTEGVYDLIKKDVLNWDGFRFDWFIKSRTPQELQRRCGTLIQLIAKEADESIGGEKTNGRKKAAATNGTTGPAAGGAAVDGANGTAKGKRKNPPSEASASRAGTPQPAGATAAAGGSKAKKSRKA